MRGQGEGDRLPTFRFTIAIVLAVFAGCVSTPPVDDGVTSPPPSTPPSPSPATSAEADPVDSTFKISEGLSDATSADEFPDANPFGYRNPFRR